MGSTTRRVLRLTLYLGWTLVLMPAQVVAVACSFGWAARLPVFYHRTCCRILGLRVRRIGRPTSATRVLFAANHVSYLDITVLGSLMPVSFIAKAEVARWPLFGWLAKLQRSVFIDRQASSIAAQYEAVAARLDSGAALMLFPEGTSGDGNRVLPFKTALFAAAGHDRKDAIAVQPVSVAYARLDGMPIGRRFRPYFAWYGDMAMAPHLWAVIGLGTIEVVVEFHPATSLAACGSRKALAQYCRDHVVRGVATALSGHPQPAPPAAAALPADLAAPTTAPVAG